VEDHDTFALVVLAGALSQPLLCGSGAFGRGGCGEPGRSPLPHDALRAHVIVVVCRGRRAGVADGVDGGAQEEDGGGEQGIAAREEEGEDALGETAQEEDGGEVEGGFDEALGGRLVIVAVVRMDGLMCRG
jgi:hypothetical protein